MRHVPAEIDISQLLVLFLFIPFFISHHDPPCNIRVLQANHILMRVWQSGTLNISLMALQPTYCNQPGK